jgi:hypothetical protein
MISRGTVADNARKISEHRLTFPIVLQKRWEISREYGMFATPIAYLIINADGIIAAPVAAGMEAISSLAKRRLETVGGQALQDRIRERLNGLQREFATGRLKLQDMEHEQVSLKETLLRIQGAMKVLEEFLVEHGPINDPEHTPGIKEAGSSRLTPATALPTDIPANTHADASRVTDQG